MFFKKLAFEDIDLSYIKRCDRPLTIFAACFLFFRRRTGGTVQTDRAKFFGKEKGVVGWLASKLVLL